MANKGKIYRLAICPERALYKPTFMRQEVFPEGILFGAIIQLQVWRRHALDFKRSLVLIGLVVLLGGFLVACQPTPSAAPPSEPGISVGITRDLCPNIIVQVGQQVTWSNQDSGDHVVHDKSDAENSQFDSGTLQPGDSFVFTFLQTGSYTYECSVNGTMAGTVTVQP